MDLTAFISDEMISDRKNNRDELIAFWKSGHFTNPDIFPDSLARLFVCGGPDELPWAARQFDNPPLGGR